VEAPWSTYVLYIACGLPFEVRFNLLIYFALLELQKRALEADAWNAAELA
jgi:hypothetical protein